jgi:hypothetical protein
MKSFSVLWMIVLGACASRPPCNAHLSPINPPPALETRASIPRTLQPAPAPQDEDEVFR